ncbi:MAG: SPOR domain-containing protein [Desulfobacterales bacterium]
MANDGKQKAAAPPPSRQSTRRIAWGRYAVIVLIAAWMFGIGVLVGRGTAPVTFDIHKLTRELESLIAADTRKQLAPVEVETGDAKTKTELDFYEELKKSGPSAPYSPPQNDPEPLREKRTPVRVSRAEEAPPAEKKEPAVRNPAKSADTKPISPAEAPPPNPAKADTGPSSDDRGKVTIQAVSLKDLAEADAVVKKLKDRGYPAYKVIAVVPGKGIWFRIRVGRYASRDAAGDVLARLKKEGYRPIVVGAN